MVGEVVDIIQVHKWNSLVQHFPSACCLTLSSQPFMLRPTVVDDYTRLQTSRLRHRVDKLLGFHSSRMALRSHGSRFPAGDSGADVH